MPKDDEKNKVTLTPQTAKALRCLLQAEGLAKKLKVKSRTNMANPNGETSVVVSSEKVSNL